MSELNLDNIVGFKAVDKDGNEQNVTVDEMVDMVATRMVSALSETSSLSEISTLATAAATGNDVYENELPTVTDAANVRVLQSSGDAAQMTMQSLATKLGELIGTATADKNGLMSVEHYNHIFPLLGIWTTNVENQVIKITFSGKWSALIGVMKNANLNGGLVYMSGSPYGASIGTLQSIVTNRLGPIGFYSKNDNPYEIIIVNMGIWAEISAIIFTGKIEKMEVIGGDKISLSDYTKMNY